MRLIPYIIPDITSLEFPPKVLNMLMEDRGLIIISGMGGSGRSSTLAAFIDFINNHRKSHIITIEDPIEFLFKDELSSIDQREIGVDTESMIDALLSSFHQDPDVLVVTDFADPQIAGLVLKATQRGCLAIVIMDAPDTIKTIDLFLENFPQNEQQKARLALADNLKCIICQKLLPHKKGKQRVLSSEVLFNTTTIKSFIEEAGKTSLIRNVMEAEKETIGMYSFDQNLVELYNKGLVSLEIAMSQTTKKSEFEKVLKLT